MRPQDYPGNLPIYSGWNATWKNMHCHRGHMLSIYFLLTFKSGSTVWSGTGQLTLTLGHRGSHWNHCAFLLKLSVVFKPPQFISMTQALFWDEWNEIHRATNCRVDEVPIFQLFLIPFPVGSKTWGNACAYQGPPLDQPQSQTWN